MYWGVFSQRAMRGNFFEVVLEGLRGEKSVAQICRERNITESLYYKWRDAFLERGVSLFEDQRSSHQDEQCPAEFRCFASNRVKHP